MHARKLEFITAWFRDVARPDGTDGYTGAAIAAAWDHGYETGAVDRKELEQRVNHALAALRSACFRLEETRDMLTETSQEIRDQ